MQKARRHGLNPLRPLVSEQFQVLFHSSTRSAFHLSLKELKRRFPEANIAAVDYDPGASEVNQINRIKLMMAVARQERSGGEPSAAR